MQCVPDELHDALLAASTRDGVVECRFRGAVVALDADGSVRLSLGRPEAPVYGRSANKPMQGAAMIRLGLNVPADLLAVVVASHSGEDSHVEQVRRLLGIGGLSDADLQNTPFAPMGEQARAAMYRRGGSPSALTGDCSGKHAGMLVTSVHNGWPLEHYLRADHPVQQEITRTIAQLSGEAASFIGTDGCGAPAHGLSLIGLARAYACIAKEQGEVYRAMVGHPYLVGGHDRPVTRLMEALPGLMAKDGADGVFAAAFPDGRAVAVKIADGAAAPRVPVTLAALQVLGVDIGPAGHLASVPVMGGGRTVGQLRALVLA